MAGRHSGKRERKRKTRVKSRSQNSNTVCKTGKKSTRETNSDGRRNRSSILSQDDERHGHRTEKVRLKKSKFSKKKSPKAGKTHKVGKKGRPRKTVAKKTMGRSLKTRSTSSDPWSSSVNGRKADEVEQPLGNFRAGNHRMTLRPNRYYYIEPLSENQSNALDEISPIPEDRMGGGVGKSSVSVERNDAKVKDVKFDAVGELKEMVIFPMIYPEVFTALNIDPPRGVVFYGPPGTGKTLVARALSNECSKGDKKVAFFMRKGADCLSMWQGESERHLRALFDQAYAMRPSIIFFDEIDGLAPSRSSKTDHGHASIVSTLLALMDGLDGRGEVVVIGATNRLDSLDPALRRPGRFDRELGFSLPDRAARKEILGIHTKNWNPPMDDTMLDELAENTVGYCGADLKGICTEAALVSLRHHYPQIYLAETKLKLDVQTIKVSIDHFNTALRNCTPASQFAFERKCRIFYII